MKISKGELDKQDVDDDIRDFFKRARQTPLQWLVIYYITAYTFLMAATLFIRPDTATNRFVTSHFNVDPISLGFFVLLTVPLIPVVYYFLKAFQYVLLAISPLMAINLILAIQVLTSKTAPLEHLLAHSGILVSFVLLFIAFDQVQAEREVNKILAEKNQMLMEKISRDSGNE